MSDSLNEKTQSEPEEEVFGKRILVSTRENWPVAEDAEVVEACRSQSDTEFWFRKLKDPYVVSSRQ